MPETVLERRRTPRMLLSLAGKMLDTTAVQELGLSADDILTMYRHMLLTRMFGDGATSTADFHGAANFAAIHHLPIVFFYHNNGVAVSTSLAYQTAVPIYRKARAYGFPGVIVDGRDPFAVYEVTQKALRRARATRVPTLIEAVVDRLDPHTTAIGVDQRTAQEQGDMQRRDPLERTRHFFLSQEAQALCGVEWCEEKDRELKARLAQEVRAAVDTHTRLGDAERRRRDGKHLIDSALAIYKAPAVQQAYRVPQQTDRALFQPKMIEDVNCCDAYGIAIYDIFRFDAQAMYLGEDIGKIGGVFRNVGIHKDVLGTLGLESYREKISVNYVSLADVLSASRFIDTPLDEHGMAGIAVGLALDGRTVFLEAQFSGFVYAMMNHIVAHMARFRQRSAGCLSQSVTVVLPYGGGIPLIEHHREEEVAPFLNSPGLTLGCPATPQEFYDLAWAAAASEKPVLLFIPKLLYRDIRVRSSLRRRMPETAIEHFGARVAHEAQESAQGGVTVIAFGRMIYTALKAAQRAKQHGIPLEVLALRTLKPLPLEAIFHSVEKTKRLVTVEEAPVFGGFGEHLVANVTNDPTMLATMWATPRCVGAPDIDHPPVPYYASYIPQTADVLKAIEDTFHEEF